MAINPQMIPQTLGLNSEPLRDFRENLDEMLRLLTVNLTERDLETGTLTAKIKITLKIPQDGERIGTMMKIEPDIGIKIGAKGTKKCETQQGIFIRYDADGVPVIAGSQISLDDYIRSRDGREESA